MACPWSAGVSFVSITYTVCCPPYDTSNDLVRTLGPSRTALNSIYRSPSSNTPAQDICRPSAWTPLLCALSYSNSKATGSLPAQASVRKHTRTTRSDCLSIGLPTGLTSHHLQGYSASQVSEGACLPADLQLGPHMHGVIARSRPFSVARTTSSAGLIKPSASASHSTGKPSTGSPTA